VAEVDGDAGLLLLHLARGGLGSSAEVAATMLEGSLGDFDYLGVFEYLLRACRIVTRRHICGGVGRVLSRDGRGRVVAHCGRRQWEPGGAAAAGRADMSQARRGEGEVLQRGRRQVSAE
jgi:hypothetical protein